MRFAPVAVGDVDGAHGTARGLLQRDHDVALDVRAAFGKILLRDISALAEATSARAAHPRAEHLLKEIAEARATKMKLLAAGRTPAAKSLSTSKSAVAGRGTEVRAGFPVRAEFVVFFALVGVGQNFVGLVDLLEFFLGLLFILGYVGMEFARELAEGFFDFIRAGGARHAETLVIIFVLNGHRERICPSAAICQSRRRAKCEGSSLSSVEPGLAEAPSTNIQAPENIQAPITKLGFRRRRT